MKKKISAIFIIVASIAIVIISYISWHVKLEDIKKNATKVVPISASGSNNLVEKSSMNLNFTDLKNYSKNSDSSVQKLLKNRLKNGQQVQMLILGSTAMEEGGEGYAALLEKSFKETYGEFITITSQPFDSTSADFISKHLNKVNWSKPYDLVLLEPFILNDNGLVPTEEEFEYIDQIKEKVRGQVKDAVVVLQPSFPIFRTSYYETNVASLKSFAKEHSFPYVNHWEEWPSSSDTNLKSYLTGDNEQPNERGTKLWAQSLSKYFTNH